MEVVLRLREAQKLIERGWCQGVSARTHYERPCHVMSKQAIEHCATGAAAAASWDSPELAFAEMMDALTDALEDLWEITPHDQYKPWHKVEAVKAWNDEKGRSKNEVLRLYARAIEMCTTGRELAEVT
jgi:hypothetical protein